ncbi:plasmid replication protein RepC [Pseudorhodobacter ferrugineus]|uniref:plasmid replication protein RepC n=1 Tax=Pseudorhodobacter ferrugineus TaxID=77008 RepID=UPI00067E137F|nr:plasmid replication protein RepC [Pseudorhodobacter ferrugineus]
MAFIQVTASQGQRHPLPLSADNSLPERHVLIETLRKAAPLLGIKPSVLTTLDAMLSCLAPKRNHHVVFASNATLAFRRNGITDRTLRRHVEMLRDAGLLERRDSPNRKRFTRHNTTEGTTLRFGLDLAPLFTRLAEFSALASQATAEQEQVRYLRCLLRSTLHAHPEHPMALEAAKYLRRKTDVATLKFILSELPEMRLEAESDQPSVPAPESKPNETAATNGQYVRHHHNSNKEGTDTKRTAFTLTDLKSACPEAMQYAVSPIETVEDVLAHAQTLAPMLGIDSANYKTAQAHVGPLGAAITVWSLLQYHNRIRSVGAYFRSLTSGSKSTNFDPFILIQQLRKQHRTAWDCPRTIT